MPNLFFQYQMKKHHLTLHKLSGTFTTKIIVIMLSGVKTMLYQLPIKSFPKQVIISQKF
jgi:hypothetical protein